MAYDSELFARARAEIDQRRQTVEAEADRRRAEVENAVPEIRELDLRLSRFGLRIMETAMAGGDTQAAISALRNENLEIQAKRATLLRKNGFPADYDKPQYDCKLCSDTGYIGIQMCSCLRRKLTKAEIEASGLAALMRTQSFENFSLDYYRQNPEDYAQMKENLSVIHTFAEQFGNEDAGADAPKNLLLFGGTGLGKTHLSTALARELIERGFDVFYNSAVGMISDFERNRFGNGIMEEAARDTSRYTECDLLILDDLGTEVVNQFTLSCLYHVLNTRLNLGRSTVINTNLLPADLRRIYNDRITSRLFGEFSVLPFRGTDVRKQKINS